MKDVKFLVDTAYQGPRRAGEILAVPDDFANRWAKNGIAEIIEKPEADAEPIEAVVEDYSKMNAKELYLVCKEKGIEAEPKKSKEYYLEKLA